MNGSQFLKNRGESPFVHVFFIEVLQDLTPQEVQGPKEGASGLRLASEAARHASSELEA